MVLRIFLDTNVWYSAIYGSPNCKKIIQAHINEKILAIISQKVLDELVRNLRKKIPEAFPTFENIITSYPPEIVADPQNVLPEVQALVHIKDQIIFTSAITARVKYFVTGNIKDFSVSRLEKLTGIRIVTPKQLVAILKL